MKRFLKKYEVPFTILVILLGLCLLFRIGNSEASVSKGDEDVDKRAEELVIDIPEPCDYGTLTVFDRDNNILHQYSGKINIKNDGKDGEKIEIIVKQP